MTVRELRQLLFKIENQDADVVVPVRYNGITYDNYYLDVVVKDDVVSIVPALPQEFLPRE